MLEKQPEETVPLAQWSFMLGIFVERIQWQFINVDLSLSDLIS